MIHVARFEIVTYLPLHCKMPFSSSQAIFINIVNLEFKKKKKCFKGIQISVYRCRCMLFSSVVRRLVADRTSGTEKKKKYAGPAGCKQTIRFVDDSGRVFCMS